MAKNITEAGIIPREIIYTDHVLQLTDALRGDEAYNLHLSGNIQINGNLHPTASGNSGEIMFTDGAGTLSFAPNSASYITSSNIDGPYGMDSVTTSSYALTASYVEVDFTERYTFTNQTTLNIPHSLDTENVIVQVYDTTGASPTMIQPSTVSIINTSNIQVIFTANTTGYVVLTRGGIVQSGNVQYALTASYAENTANTRFEQSFTAINSNTFTHNLGKKYVLYKIYDANDLEIIPSSAEALDSNNLFVSFTSPTTGNIVIL